MTFLQMIWSAIRGVPWEPARWACVYVMRFHSPIAGLCVRHPSPVEWPCEDYMRADRTVDRILARR